ncbi:MAG: NUDIX hydrolase [Paracoccus sp. (in: a-proteobacteria)]
MLRDALGRVLGRRPLPLQVGAICRDPGSGQLLLITSRGTGRWIIPKGWPMTGRSAAEAALREAWEEAGVKGTVHSQPLGRYRYAKRHRRAMSTMLDVQVHLVDVEALADDFPEVHQRKRHWFPPQEAAGLIAEPELAALILALPEPDPA